MNDVQRIDLNDYVQTGEGGTAASWPRKDDAAEIILDYIDRTSK